MQAEKEKGKLLFFFFFAVSKNLAEHKKAQVFIPGSCVLLVSPA